MNIRKILIIGLGVTVFAFGLLSGCKTNPAGQGSAAVNNAQNQINTVQQGIAENNSKRLESIAVFAYGTNFSLSRLYQYPEFESLPFDFKSLVGSAVMTNNFVRELAPAPDSTKMLEMEKTITSLTSELESEREYGLLQITEFENEIAVLNKQSSTLQIELASANKKFNELTVSLGQEVDSLNLKLKDEEAKTKVLQDDLDKFDDGFGWYAIWHGVKVFFKKIMWITIGFTAVFFILKAFASSNPIAGAIFSVFESIVGFFIKGVFSIFPKAVKFSGNIDLPTFNSVKSSRDKLVDTMESLYQIEKATPGKTFTLSEVFDQLEKNMDTADKEEIETALKKLGWK